MLSTPPSLLERLKQPDQQKAWDTFVQLYTPLLCQWSRRLGLRDPDIADLVQEVFLKIFRKLTDFIYEPDKSFRGWLRTVLINHWRNLQARRARPIPDGNLDRLAAPPVANLLEEEEYRRMVVGRALRLLQAEFPDSVWKSFWHYAVEGQPPRDVARQLNLTVNMVYLAKSRVLTRLRAELRGLVD